MMGIVNASPDSFSGDGRAGAAAVEHALAQWRDGADILDIGGESTRPGHTPISVEEELRRVLPVIETVRDRLPLAPISVDTYKPDVLRAARAAGADILNSVWGLDEPLLEAAVECGVPVVIMHNGREAGYPGSAAAEVAAALARQARRAVSAGIDPAAVILDPGIGFAKSPDENIEILAALDRLTSLGYPTLLGTSRKSTLGKLTGKDASGRAFATAATVALGVAAGIDIMRVHDVAAMRDVIAVADAVVRGRRPADWSTP